MIANQRKLGHAALTNRLRGAGSRKQEERQTKDEYSDGGPSDL